MMIPQFRGCKELLQELWKTDCFLNTLVKSSEQLQGMSLAVMVVEGKHYIII